MVTRVLALVAALAWVLGRGYLDPGRHGTRGDPAAGTSWPHETAAGVLSSLDRLAAQAARIERRQGFMLEARAACEDPYLGCEWGARSWTVLPGPIARCECVVPSLARGRR